MAILDDHDRYVAGRVSQLFTLSSSSPVDYFYEIQWNITGNKELCNAL